MIHSKDVSESRKTETQLVRTIKKHTNLTFVKSMEVSKKNLPRKGRYWKIPIYPANQISFLPQRMNTFQSLGGLRGICSLLIVIGHFFTFFAPVDGKNFPSATIDYLPPVSLFFILSGFLLGVLYQDKLGEWSQRKDFWIKRFARLAPMYYFGLLLGLPALIAYNYNNLFNLISSLILAPIFLQSFTIIGTLWDGPLWQVSAFALCYFLYPFLLKFFRSRNPWLWGTILYLFSLALFVLSLIFGIPTVIIHLWFVARAPHFFIGVIMGIHFPKDQKEEENSLLIQKGEEQIKEKPHNTFKHNLIVDLLSFLFFGLFAFCLVLGFVWGGSNNWLFMTYAEEFTLIPLYCFWIYSLCQAKGGITVKFFNSWVMEKLGDISYSIYVIHFPILDYFSWLKVQKIAKLQTDFQGPFVLDNYEVLSVLGIVICASILTYHYIENPARDWIIKKMVAKKPTINKPTPTGA